MLSQTTSPPESTVVTKSTVRPFGCGRTSCARVVTVTVSPTSSSRCAVMEFARCTAPTAANGKVGSVRIARCSRKASRWGYVSGTVSLTGKPHTPAYDVTGARSMVTAGREKASPENPPPLRMPGSWLTTGIDGSAARSRVATPPGSPCTMRTSSSPPVEPFPSLVEPFPSLVEPFPSLVEPFPSLVEPFPSLVEPVETITPPASSGRRPGRRCR